jgi:hypothetical protein
LCPKRIDHIVCGGGGETLVARLLLPEEILFGLQACVNVLIVPAKKVVVVLHQSIPIVLAQHFVARRIQIRKKRDHSRDHRNCRLGDRSNGSSENCGSVGEIVVFARRSSTDNLVQQNICTTYLYHWGPCTHERQDELNAMSSPGTWRSHIYL